MINIIEQFIEFMNSASTLKKYNLVEHDAFEHAYVIALFSESKKRRMNESEKDLLFDAALSMIETYREDFDKHRKDNNPGFYYQWRQRDCEYVASDIVESIKQNNVFKKLVHQWLCECRIEIFEEEAFKHYLKDCVIEEHPMQTFVFWLDYIDNLKGLADYKNWLVLKRNLVNLVRVGNTTFRRSEWQNTVTKMGA